ncbi:MAG: acyltransferase [Bradyrhizobium sp.]|nr:acyltransferase [Bradyrhizobium sp.]
MGRTSVQVRLRGGHRQRRTFGLVHRAHDSRRQRRMCDRGKPAPFVHGDRATITCHETMAGCGLGQLPCEPRIPAMTTIVPLATAAEADLGRRATVSAWRADIDGLRAIAVSTVVLFHAFPSLCPGGFVGVDIFFVISGFLITGILLRDHEAGAWSIWQFYARRARRIFPALSVVIITTIAAVWLFGIPDQIAMTAKHGVAGALSAANIAFWREVGYFDVEAHSKPFLHLWSLGVEEQFYIVWPLVVALFVRKPIVLAAVTAMICAASFCATVWFNTSYPGLVFYLPFFRAWELGAGALAAILIRIGWSADRLVHSRAKDVLQPVGLLLIVLSVFLLDSSVPFPGTSALAPVLGATLIVWGGAGAAIAGGIGDALLSNRLAVYVGRISYSLYLWHWPLLTIPAAAGLPLSAMGKSILIGVAVALSAMTLQWIEIPARTADNAKRATFFSCVALIGAMLACVVVYGVERWSRADARAIQATLAWPAPEEGRASCPDELRRMPEPPTICRANKAAPPTAVVWGDSHADHLYPGLIERDGSRSWLLIANPSCPPTSDIHIILGKAASCDPARTERVLGWLVAQKQVEFVVIGFFGHYFEANFVADGHVHGPFAPSDVRISGSNDAGEKRRYFLDGLRSSVQRLLAAGKKVVLVVDVPELPFKPSHCLLDPTLRLVSPVCRIPLEQVLQRQQALRDLIADIAASNPRVIVADPLPALCADGFCGVDRSSRASNYRDSHHLSVAGSAAVAGAILSAIASSTR